MSSATNIFSGLLPESYIWIDSCRSRSIRDLNHGDSIVVSGYESDFQNLNYSKISEIKLSEKSLESAILITLKSNNGELSTLTVDDNQMFCIPGNCNGINERSSLPSLWLKAVDLKKDLQIRGYNENFTIDNVQQVDLNWQTDLYELSLEHNHTFYIADTNGNYILTHNIICTLIIGTCIGAVIGAVIGGTAGGTIAAYNAYGYDTMSTKIIVKGVVVGAIIGGAAGCTIYLGCYGGVALANIIPKLTAKIIPLVIKNPIITKAVAKLLNQCSISFLGTVTCIMIGTTMIKSVELTNEEVGDFVEETARRKKADIDFSSIKFKGKNKVPRKRTGKEKIIEEDLLDEKGNPIRDKNGEKIKLFFVVEENA